MRCGGLQLDPDVRRKRAQFLFGTLCAIEVSGPDDAALSQALEDGFRELARVQDLLNPFDSRSAVSRINEAAPDGPVPVTEELRTLLEASLHLSQRTAGRYDVTMWPLLELWRACEREQRWPTRQERREAVAAIDYRRVHVGPRWGTIAFTDPRTRLDPSSFAKGYALDCGLRVLRAYPLETATLNAGGEVLAWRADGRPVAIGLADAENRRELAGGLTVRNQAVATAGQREPHLVIGDRTVGHLFDLQTGLPLESLAASVTVIATSALVADVCATVAFLVGPAEANALLQPVPGIRVIWQIRESWDVAGAAATALER